MFRELEPYLKKEQVVTDHSLVEPAGDYERISREDAAAAMEVIVAHLDK
ncbi:MAG: hypothetical protein LUH04_06880 [Clostridium sp.]|nr:hypothetical protein [Clostridium sp.]